MSAHVRITNELKAALELASVLMTKADSEQRELTADERAQVDAHLEKARTLKAELQRAKDIDALQDDLKQLVSDAAPAAPKAVARGSMGAQFVASLAMEFIRAGHARGGSWATPSVELFAATLTEDAASGGKLLVPQYQAGIQPLPFAPPKVSELFAQGTTDAASIVYMVEKVATNAAGPVAEGAPKPESTLTFDSVTDAVKKVATWLPVSEEMLQDVAQIESYINGRLQTFVALAMDQQVISGDGLAGAMVGLLNRAGLATAVARGATELNAMAIYRQIVEIMTTAMLMPDAVVMSPRAWGSMVTAQNAQGVFYGPGMFAAIPSPSIWGLTVAITSTLPDEDSAIVGAFKQGGQLWKRTGITVQASNSHSDYFVRNLVAIRAEQRAALAVYRPGAFGLVTGLEVLGPPVALLSGGQAGFSGGSGATSSQPAAQASADRPAVQSRRR